MQISTEQKEIINSEKNTIVVSNPGTGKTTTLSLRVLKLLEDGVDPQDILCITFTDKARKEMFDTIHAMAGKKFSDAELVKINIHTFHSFAYNYLQDTGIISGDIVGNNVMRYSILESFIQNKALNYGKDYLISEIVPKTENAIRYIKNFGITPEKINVDKANLLLEKSYDKKSTFTLEELQFFLKYFIDAYKKYEESKNNAVDYSDMLLTFKEKFRGEKFEHVLVDEMQDMNEIESEIVRMVGKNLFLVGDAKQAIFGFQGGSVKNFKRFTQLYDTKILSANRRSTQQILDYSKEYFLEKTSHKDMFDKELKSLKSSLSGDTPKIVFTSAPLSTILDVIEANPKKSIGIITRTNKQIIDISKFLDSNDIPYSSTSFQATAQQAKEEILTFIRGMLSFKIEDKVLATFTLFSQYTLQEAFEFSKGYKENDRQKLSPIQSWGTRLTRKSLEELFMDKIFPLCISKGFEWYATAQSVKDQLEQYLVRDMPTMEGLFDYIAIGEESYIERNSKSNITLTTVHKAKGRAFDVVVYLPSTLKKTSFIDKIVDAVIASSGIDMTGELEEESLRVDFVAFTRAKEKLTVITENNTSLQNYHFTGLSTIEYGDSKDEDVAIRSNHRLSEAYSLFLYGKHPESEKLRKREDDWLREYIYDYFKNVDHFSYSSIKTKPYDFLIGNIIKVPFTLDAIYFGSDVHDALSKILNDDAKITAYKGNVRKSAQNGLDAIKQLEKDYPGLKIVDTERHYKISLSSMTDYDDDIMLFTGYLDAIFKHDNGYLIVDYKTDKNSKRSSEHKRQLAVYKKMHSLLKNIPEEKISTYVLFIALRGSINTEKFGLETSQGTRDVYPTFEKHLQKILGWKRDPESFIEELLELKDNDTVLYAAIKEKLTSSDSRR